MVAFGKDQYVWSNSPAMTRMIVARLRERAAQCHRRALQAYSEGIAAELEQLALDYEKDALRLEAAVPESKRSGPDNSA